MPGLVATFVSVEIILWNEINVVEDETVESVNFHGLFDSDVHDSAFVEYVVAKLKSNESGQLGWHLTTDDQIKTLPVQRRKSGSISAASATEDEGT